MGLSKTTYKMGLNCERSLWLHVNEPQEADERFADSSAALGAEVGILARDYFEGTVCADNGDADDPGRLAKAALRTTQLLGEGCPCIAEATFFYDGHKCQVDLLRRVEGGFELIECKSACNVCKSKGCIREDYLEDASFQLWLLRQCGVPVSAVKIMHPDSGYRLHGSLDVRAFFAFEDVTAGCEERTRGMGERVRRIAEVASLPTEPAARPGACCCSPKCPFLGHCIPSAKNPDSVVWVGGISRAKAIDYILGKGIDTMGKLLRSTPAERGQRDCRALSATVRAQAAGADYVDVDKLAAWLANLEGEDLYWLDFETCQYPVPRYEGDRPWAQVPTQYSLHITRAGGEVEHREFLAHAGRDPWREVAESLASDIPMGAVTVAYNKTFERDRIREMAAKFPDLESRLLDIVREDNPYGKARKDTDLSGLGLVDLIDPFRKGWVYRPAMQGSKSIKFVLPALFPDDPALDYHNLASHSEDAPAVQNGTMAIAAFAALEDMGDPGQVAATRENLLRYCELDTWAMVAIYRRLLSIAKGDGFDADIEVSMGSVWLP